MTTESASGLTIKELDAIEFRFFKGGTLLFDDAVKAFAAARQSLEAGEWKPIDSAPKDIRPTYVLTDGKTIWLSTLRGGDDELLRWVGWDKTATHWMALPPAASAPASAMDDGSPFLDGQPRPLRKKAPPAQSEPPLAEEGWQEATPSHNHSDFGAAAPVSVGSEAAPDKPQDLKERLATDIGSGWWIFQRSNRDRAEALARIEALEKLLAFRAQLNRDHIAAKDATIAALQDDAKRYAELYMDRCEKWSNQKESLETLHKELEAFRNATPLRKYYEGYNAKIDEQAATIADLREKLDKAERQVERFQYPRDAIDMG